MMMDQEYTVQTVDHVILLYRMFEFVLGCR